MSKFDTVQELIDFVTKDIQRQAPPMQWINGVLFVFNAMLITDEINKELIAGKLYWDYVAFAPLKEYCENMNNTSNQTTVPIQNVSHNETFQAIGQFLKNQFQSACLQILDLCYNPYNAFNIIYNLKKMSDCPVPLAL